MKKVTLLLAARICSWGESVVAGWIEANGDEMEAGEMEAGEMNVGLCGESEAKCAPALLLQGHRAQSRIEIRRSQACSARGACLLARDAITAVHTQGSCARL
jgi:hypothetical protein